MQANTISELEAKVVSLSERNARNEANLDMMQEDLEDAQAVRESCLDAVLPAVMLCE
jgi:uncharacterized coiled-coil protein SlyX